MQLRTEVRIILHFRRMRNVERDFYEKKKSKALNTNERLCLSDVNRNLPLFFLSLENRVKETLHKAFWDRLKKQISASPPDYTQAIQLLQEIKEVS